MTLPTLRPYQLRAVTAMAREIGLVGAGYRKSTLGVQACGTGKSLLAAALTRLALKRGMKRVLITAPRGELLAQNERWVQKWLPSMPKGQIGWEKATSRAHGGHKVVMGSLATLRDADRRNAMPKPDLVIVDEAHLEVDALEALFETFPEAKRIGLTATPDRLDLRAITPRLFEAIHPEAIYEIGDAMRDGFLASIRAKQIRWNYPGSPTSSGALASEMLDGEILDQTALAALNSTEGLETLVFCCDLKHARSLRHRINAWHPKEELPSRVISGDMPAGERREILEDFEDGKFRILLTVTLLSFGWDCPRASAAIMARPTKSRSLWTQCIGRVLRLYPGKKDALVLDLWGGLEELSLVTPESAMRSELEDYRRVTPKELIEIARTEDAEKDLLEELESDVGLEDFPSEPPEKAYTLHPVAIDLECIEVELAESTTARRISPKQERLLKELGVDVDVGDLDIEQASELIGALLEREARGMCTLRQARTLQLKGLRPNVTKEVANLAIGRIKENHWKVPPDIWARADLRVTGKRPIVSGG